MSDIAAPAPAAPTPAPNGSAGPQAPGQAPQGAPKPGSARMADGRFAPKDGAVGAVPQGEQPKGAKGGAPAEPDAWRFKEKLNVYGEDEEVDLDREGVKRQLQKLRALEKKQLPEYQKNDALARQLLQLAKSDPRGFLRETGQDPAQFARQMLAEEARLGAMTEEEKAIHERDQKIAAYEAKEKERTEQETKAKKEATHQRLVSTIKEKVGGALKAVAPALGDNHEALGVVVEALKAQLAVGQSLKDVSAEELARDAINQRHGQMRNWAKSMDGATLAKELGPKAVQALLEHSLADFEKSQGFEAPAEQPPAPTRNDGPREYLSAADVAENLRKMRNGR